jgi:predicted nucleotidyltransferase
MSHATGTEQTGSDIDLLFDMGTPMSLMELGALERRLSELLGAPVDLIPAAALRPDLRDLALAEAVTL